MVAKLPSELLSKLAAHPDEALPVSDDAGKTFYVVSEARLTHLEAAAQEQSEATLDRIRALIEEGDNSPDVDGQVVHRELLARAKKIDAAAS